MRLMPFAGSESMKCNQIVSAKEMKDAERAARRKKKNDKSKSVQPHRMSQSGKYLDDFIPKEYLEFEPQCRQCDDTGVISKINGVSVLPVRCCCGVRHDH